MKPLVGLSLMHEPEFLQAALPLFQNSEVDCVEWSFDTIRNENFKPAWLHELLKAYSENGRLIGHGVKFSIFDALWTKRQDKWLNDLKKEVKKYHYVHITEHFGFMSNNDFHKGTPLPVPLGKNTLQIGRDRLKQIQNAAQLPVGIENLPFSFSKEDVKSQGEFLKKLIASVNGFIILDLHNVFCQAKNFKVDIHELIALYPLDRVKEIHISGGSWQNSVYTKNIKKVRRDTHDERVPSELFPVLEATLKKCPHLEYVIFERLGHTLGDRKEQAQFRKDFLKIKKIVNSVPGSSFKRAKYGKGMKKEMGKGLSDKKLNTEQRTILKALKNISDPNKALTVLKQKQLPDWKVEYWNPSMVETAIALIKKWG